MARIKPFRGLCFNPMHIANLSDVIGQPYDRIGPDLQAQYEAQHPHHIVRIIKGRDLPGDTEQHNVYTRARKYADLWQADRVLVRDEQPAFYVYAQMFESNGRTLTRAGLIAALELSGLDQGIVLPHERTHSGPKLDRLRLLRATETHWGQIFMLYPDSERQMDALLGAAIADRLPNMEATERFEQGVCHRVWRVTDPQIIQLAQDILAPMRHLIIADGHHRYETALTYRDEMRARRPAAAAEAAFNYVMVTLVSMSDAGLIILPTHREVFGLPISGADVQSRVMPWFEVQPAADLDACLWQMQEQEDRHAIGMLAENGYCVLVLREPLGAEKLISGSQSAAWKSLDVSILHKIILEPVVGLSEQDVEREAHIRYYRDARQLARSVGEGSGQMAFFLNPTRIAQVQACAQNGDKMPQKSTDFYPKMVTGLVFMPVPPQECL